MKTKLRKWTFKTPNYLLATLFIVLVQLNTGFAQSETEKINEDIKFAAEQFKSQETIGEERILEKKINIDSRPIVRIETKNAKTKILPAKGNEIITQVIYTAITETDEDLELLKKNMGANLIQRNGNEVSIKLDFYKTMTTVITPLKWKTNIKLKDGNKIKLAEFKIKEIKVYVPADLDLTIDTKYDKVKLEFSVKGNLNLNIYDCEFEGKSVSGNLKLDAKYSNIEFNSIPTAKLDLYECTFKSNEIKNVAANSKYSNIQISNTENISFDCYEGKVEIDKANIAKVISKYCNISIDQIDDRLKLDAYEGSFTCETLGTANISSKYLKVELSTVKTLSLTEGYETDFEIEIIDSLKSELGKFNEFKIGKLNTIAIIDGYEEELEVVFVSEKFEKIWVNGKYIDTKINLPKNIDYKLWGKIQYADLNINRTDYKVVLHDEENSTLKFEYYKNKQTAKKEIRLNGYEIDLKLGNY